MASSNKEVRLATPRARAKWSEENRGGQETGDSSFRVPYYGATGASVPFMWESQPGTPKHHIFSKNDHFALPLTPPPSYTCSFSPSPSPAAPSRIKTRKAGFFSAFLSSFSRKANRHANANATSSSPSDSGPLSWTTASSSSSPPSSPPRHSTAKSQSPLFDDDEDRQKMGSRNKQIMCFGYNNMQGCYSMLNVKSSIVSIKGH